MERKRETSSSTVVISWKRESSWEPMRVPQLMVRARDKDKRWMHGIGSIGSVPSLPYFRNSATKSLVSTSRCGM